MDVQFFKTNWEVPTMPFAAYLAQVKNEGYHGIEIPFSVTPATIPEIRTGLAAHELALIGMIYLVGETPAAQLEEFREQLALAQSAGAHRLNSHSGSDFFTFEENVSLLRDMHAVAAEAGLPLSHETHRGRALFNLPDTLRYLDALPELRLTADLSHFMCVHESELRERRDLLTKLFPHVDHVHARIGFPEGPQVAHPFAPEWAELRAFYLDSLWKPILASATARGMAAFTITPEAGPPPYMPTLPFSAQPVADAWQVNATMHTWLAEALT